MTTASRINTQSAFTVLLSIQHKLATVEQRPQDRTISLFRTHIASSRQEIAHDLDFRGRRTSRQGHKVELLDRLLSVLATLRQTRRVWRRAIELIRVH